MGKTKKVQKALEELGDTPEQVAASLRELGIKGVPLHAVYCPIAKFVAKTIYRSSTAQYSHSTWCSIWGWYAVPNPWAVSKFIEKFDTYQYPELIEG